jgi:uncharacterized OsmC-like protein
MQIDYERLNSAVAETIHEIRSGSKDPVRRPRAQIRVVRDLQGEVTAGPFRFRTDAARDAGGFGEHPRPMDYLLGALASCQQMWCLRWAAARGLQFSELVIEAESNFTWRGEYLQETDAAITQLHVSYRASADGLNAEAARHMADMVARRCPVMATLRRAAPITEEIHVAGEPVIARLWKPGVADALGIDSPPV